MCWVKLLQSCIRRSGIIIILCNVLDVISTWYALNYLNAIELNPIVNYLLSIGWLPALMFKFVGTIIACYCLYEIEQRWPRKHIYALWVLVIMYMFIYLNNMGVIYWLTA